MIQLKKSKGEFEECKWVVNLLESKFFGTCIDHQSQRKNEKNMFCIDCNLCFCKHCVTGAKTRCHQHHRRLQICRYVYHDVVRLQEIQKHFNCSNIQTYKINGEKAVHLNPRPHQHKEMKQSKSKMYGTYCEACGRHIQDVPSRFCSIACKVSVVVIEDINKQECREMMAFSFYNKESFDFKGNESSFSSSDSVEENIQASPWLRSTVKAKKSVVHKRKGIPRRAPLC